MIFGLVDLMCVCYNIDIAKYSQILFAILNIR